MLQKHLKSLRRSISEKLLGAKLASKTAVSTPTISECERVTTSTQSLADDMDPFQECLHANADNVSHIVFHGSSLKSLSSYDLNREARRKVSRRVPRSSESSSGSTQPAPKTDTAKTVTFGDAEA